MELLALLVAALALLLAWWDRRSALRATVYEKQVEAASLMMADIYTILITTRPLLRSSTKASPEAAEPAAKARDSFRQTYLHYWILLPDDISQACLRFWERSGNLKGSGEDGEITYDELVQAAREVGDDFRRVLGVEPLSGDIEQLLGTRMQAEPIADGRPNGVKREATRPKEGWPPAGWSENSLPAQAAVLELLDNAIDASDKDVKVSSTKRRRHKRD